MAADAICAVGGAAEPLILDVSDAKAVEDVVSKHGPFDVLVNNAGTNRPKPMEEVTAEDYEAVMGLT